MGLIGNKQHFMQRQGQPTTLKSGSSIALRKDLQC